MSPEELAQQILAGDQFNRWQTLYREHQSPEAAWQEFLTEVFDTEDTFVLRSPSDNADEPLTFAVDLQEYDDIPDWIHAAPIGTYQHPVYGEIKLDNDKVIRMARNINTGVRGQDLDIDYEHKKRDGKAAGWVKKAQARENGLWLQVDWTDPAKQAIQNKEYRYFSPELADAWQHPQSGETYKDVVLGGALTNRPFLKGILPINLSEVIDTVELIDQFDYEGEDVTKLRDIPQSERKKRPSSDFAGKGRSFPIIKPADVAAAASSMGRAGSDNYDTATLKRNIIRIAKRKGSEFVAKLPESWKGNKSEEDDMDEFIKKLRETLGLSESDDEEAILNRVQEVSASGELVGQVRETLGLDEDGDLASTVKQLNETAGKKLEDETRRQKFAEEFPEEAKELEELARKTKENAVTKKMEEWARHPDSNLGIPPAIEEQVREYRMKLDDDQAMEFDKIMDTITHKGVVDFSEIGSGAPTEGGDAQDKLDRLIDKKMEEDSNLSVADAQSKVLEENPDLAKEWLNSAGGPSA